MASFAQKSSLGAHTIQSTSGQDYSWHHVEEDKIWMVAIDGHGKHKEGIGDLDLVDWLKAFNWAELMRNRESENPICKLETIIVEAFPGGTQGIGAAISIIEITDEREVEIWWKGDAATKIMQRAENGEVDIVASTQIPDHDAEMERISDSISCYKPTWQVEAISETEITMRKTYYYHFSELDVLAMSQSIGHDGKTGIVDQSLKYILEDGKEYRILAASDGLWDIAALKDPSVLKRLWESDAQGIVEWAAEQWKRTWCYVFGDSRISDQKIGNPDDVTCVVWSKAF
tara:strand:- start:1498 stop:2358 length:861 start_codon:yes stop_codon:yes gene_type:complete